MPPLQLGPFKNRLIEEKKFKLNLTSHNILRYLCSADLPKNLLSIHCVNILFFSIFFNRFFRVEDCGVTPHCLYRHSIILKTIFKKLSRNLCFMILIMAYSNDFLITFSYFHQDFCQFCEQSTEQKNKKIKAIQMHVVCNFIKFFIQISKMTGHG